MTPEIRRLQVLNDLVAQTLDVIQQRTFVDPVRSAFGQDVYGFGPASIGLSHSPYQPAIAQIAAAYRPAYYGMPMPAAIPTAFGVVSPIAAQMSGLSHTPYTDPRLAGIGAWPYAMQGRAFGFGTYAW